MIEEKNELNEQETVDVTRDQETVNTKEQKVPEGDDAKTEADAEAYEKQKAAEMSEEEREEFVKGYNESNKGQTKLLNIKPTEEQVNEAKKNYEEANKKLGEMKFTIADKETALRVATFLRDWNKYDALWEKDMWQGCIFFNDIINDFLKKYQGEPKALELDYGSVTYLYLCLMNVKGKGLKEARVMQKSHDIYTEVLDTVAIHIDTWKKAGEEVNFLQNVWAAAAYGFVLEKCTEQEKEEAFIAEAAKQQAEMEAPKVSEEGNKEDKNEDKKEGNE